MEDLGFGSFVSAQGERQPLATQIMRCIGEMLALEDQLFSKVDVGGFQQRIHLAIQ